ncbi:hypothetical protein B0H16DRAFT_1878256 [Mycena metata]|uniref:Uncharacterized protein n=1 Tax=Mycena metata TaxID=1033252 RepID=A0AAD7KC69_9AGAR|nr:hypothetical protein B0H16DRAFT_1878256 [Mycena metata]
MSCALSTFSLIFRVRSSTARNLKEQAAETSCQSRAQHTCVRRPRKIASKFFERAVRTWRRPRRTSRATPVARQDRIPSMMTCVLKIKRSKERRDCVQIPHM